MKTILITGASSGIGKALALAYAGPGTTLFLTGRNKQRLEELVKFCEQAGAKAEHAVLDIQDRNSVRTWVEQCDNKQPLDLVIANAGISNAGEDRTEDYERLIFNVNLIGVLNTIYPAIELMEKRHHGQIAIMSSLASMHGLPRCPAYSSSKAAVRVFGQSLRNKLKPYNIKVSVICPGFIKTPLTDKNKYVMPFLMSAEKAAKLIIKALRRNRGLFAFPLRMYFPLYIIRTLPHKIAEQLLKFV